MSDKETKEFFSNLNLAEQFTGDTKKAKLMTEGAYQDIIAVKCRFKDDKDDFFGHLTLFINKFQHYILDKIAIVANYGSLYAIRPFDHWKLYISKINKELDYDKHNKALTKQLLDNFSNIMTPDQIKDISKRCDKNDLNGLTKIFNTGLTNIFNRKDIELAVDFDDSNSIEVNHVCGSLPPNYDSSSKETGSDKLNLLESLKQMAEFEKKHQDNIISAKAELSPTKGKALHKIEPGDRIMVIIKEDSQKAIDTITKLDAYTYGKVKPVEAVVLANFPSENGNVVYSKVDDNVILKMAEREGIRVKCLNYEANVKEQELNLSRSVSSESKSKSKIIIILAVIIIIIIFIILRLLNE